MILTTRIRGCGEVILVRHVAARRGGVVRMGMSAVAVTFARATTVGVIVMVYLSGLRMGKSTSASQYYGRCTRCHAEAIATSKQLQVLVKLGQFISAPLCSSEPFHSS